MVGKFLTVQTDIDHIEGIIVVEEWDIWEFAMNFLLGICSLYADPILDFCLSLCFRIALEAYCNAFSVLLD